jgi:hypothetical protein
VNQVLDELWDLGGRKLWLIAIFPVSAAIIAKNPFFLRQQFYNFCCFCSVFGCFCSFWMSGSFGQFGLF